MKLILKSYLKTFSRNLIATLGTLFFIIMLTSIVVGMLATPLQINAKTKRYERQNVAYDFYQDKHGLEYDFIYDYLLEYSVSEEQKTNYNDLFNKLSFDDKNGNSHIDDYIKINYADLKNAAGYKMFENGIKPIADDSTYSLFSDELLFSLLQLQKSMLVNLKDDYDKQINFKDNNEMLQDGFKKIRETLSAQIYIALLVFDSGQNISAGNFVVLNDQNKDQFSNMLFDSMVKDIEILLKDNLTPFNNVQKQTANDLFSAIVRLFYSYNKIFKINGGPGIDLNQISEKIIKLIEAIIGGETIEEIKIKIEEIKSNIKEQINSNIDVSISNNSNFKLTSFILLSSAFRFELNNNYQNNFNNYLLYKILNKNQDPNEFGKTEDFEYEADLRFIYSKLEAGSVSPTKTIELSAWNNNTSFNNVILEQGRLPIDELWIPSNKNQLPEIVLSPGYAKMNDIKIGDVITLPSATEYTTASTAFPVSEIEGLQNEDLKYLDEINFKVVGIGLKYDQLVPGKGFNGFLSDIKTYGLGYVSKSTLNRIYRARWNYSNTLDQTNFNQYIRIKKMSNKSPRDFFIGNINNKSTLKNNPKTAYVFDKTSTQFLDFSSSKTAISLSNIRIQIIVYIVIGIVVLVLAFIFINFIIKKEINETRKQLGIFKSFGYKVSELSWIFAIKTLITIFVGIVIGYLISIPLQQYAASNFTKSVTFDFASIYLSYKFLIVLGIVIPLIIMLVSYGVTIYYLLEPTLSLIGNSARASKKNHHLNRFSKYMIEKQKWFTYRLQRSFVRNAKGKYIVVQTLFVFSALLYTLMFGAQAIMQQTIKQGFSILQSGVDHQMYWKNRSEYQWNSRIEQYEVSQSYQSEYNQTKVRYLEYSNQKSVNETLNQDELTSNSRYLSRLLFNFITWKYNHANGSSTNKNIDMLISNEKIQQMIDESKNNLASPKAIDPNYYLFFVLTIRVDNPNLYDNFSPLIERLKNNDQNLGELSKDFEKIIDDNKTEAYVDWQNSDDSAEIIRQFNQTLFGLLGADVDSENNVSINNNIFLSDVSRILSLELAEKRAISEAQIYINKNKDDVSLNPQKVKDYIRNLQIFKEFDPENSRYWSMINNPFIDLSAIAKNDSKSNEKENNSEEPESGLTFDKLSKAATSIIMTSMMIDKPKTLDDEAVILANEFLYDKDNEFLYSVEQALIDQSEIDSTTKVELNLIDFENQKFGNVRNLLNFEDVTEEQFQLVSQSEVNSDDSINGIIPYALARNLKLNIGDKLYLTTKTDTLTPYVINVVGINKSITFSISEGWPIMINYNTYAKKMFSEELNQQIATGKIPYQFSGIYSRNKLLEGKVDLKNISNSISAMKYRGKVLSLNVKNDSSIFMSIFDGLLGDSASTITSSLKIDDKISLITNPNIAFMTKDNGVAPYNIILVTVDDLTQSVEIMLTIFLLLQTVLLAIILIVVMNIVVDEATMIILTMRALGYKTFEINWAVMGKYAVGALVSFIFAYAFSLIIWKVVLLVVGNVWQVYIFLPFDWKALVITFVVLASVVGLGWYTSYKQVNKHPLTQITNFS